MRRTSSVLPCSGGCVCMRQKHSFTLPISQTVAEERMGDCKNMTHGNDLCSSTRTGSHKSLFLYHEYLPVLFMFSAPGQSRKSLQQCSHEEGLEDPWKSYGLGSQLMRNNFHLIVDSSG